MKIKNTSECSASIFVGQRIKNIRRGKGLTGKELGDKIGLSQQHVSRIENGAVNISVDLIYELSRVLDVTLSDLIDGVGFQSKTLKPPFSCKTTCQADGFISINLI